MSVELIKIETINPVELFGENDSMGNILATIRSQAKSLVFDVTVKKDRAEMISLAAKVAKTKTALEAMGKAQVKNLKDKAAIIDDKRNVMKSNLDNLKEEIRKPVTEFENKEKERIASIKFRLDQFEDISNQAILYSDTSKDIRDFYNKIKATAIDESWEEYKDEAEHLKTTHLYKIKQRYDIVLKQEKDAEELKELRARQEEADRAEQVRAAKEEAIAETKREAEQLAVKEAAAAQARTELLQAEKEKAEREKIEAIQREKQAALDHAKAIQVEIEKVAQEKIEAEEKAKQLEIQYAEDRAAAVKKAEEEKIAAVAVEKQRADTEATEKARVEKEAEDKRRADILHTDHIDTQVHNALFEIVSNPVAEEILKLIKNNKIPHVTINY